MKTILYATDCSEHSIPVLRYAYNLSNRLNARLVVLNVFDIPLIRVSTTRPSNWIEKNTMEEHLELTKTFCSKNLEQKLDEMNIQIEAIKNVVVSDGILSKTKELSPDLLVIGMKDEHTQRGLFASDIAKTLLKKIPCPLLAIPNDIKETAIKNIVYATDYEEDDIFAIKKLINIAKPFGAKIYVFHVATKEEYASKDQLEWFKEMLQQKVSYKNIDFDLIFSDHIYREINKYLTNTSADMLAMLEREERDFLRKLFHKDLVKKMESHIKIPLLSFNKAVREEVLNPLEI